MEETTEMMVKELEMRLCVCVCANYRNYIVALSLRFSEKDLPVDLSVCSCM